MENNSKTHQQSGKKTDFNWTDDEIQLLLEVCYELKAESDYEGVNFESKRTKYELIKSRFCDQYPGVEDDDNFPRSKILDSITKERVSAKIKSIRANFKKAVDTGKRSGGGRIIFTYYDICEKIWGGSPAVKSISNGIDTSSPKESVNDQVATSPNEVSDENSSFASENRNEDSLTEEFEKAEQFIENTGSKSSLDYGGEAESVDFNHAEVNGNEELNISMDRIRRETNERRKKVDEGLKNRREKKLVSKLSTETQMLNLTKEDVSLKRKLVEKFDQADLEFNVSLNKVLKTMDNFGSAIQKSVGIMAQLVSAKTRYHSQQRPPYSLDEQRYGDTLQMRNANQSFYPPQHGIFVPPNFQTTPLSDEESDKANTESRSFLTL